MGRPLSFFTRIIPKFRIAKFPGGSAMSVRCGDFGCDSVDSKTGYRLIQYGRKGGTIKFVCIVSKHALKPPMLLYSSGWKCIYYGKSIIAGVTKKPVSLMKLWGVSGG